MKILVTGGAGFIGSHVVDRYLREGHTVCVLDNLVTGNRQNLNPQARFFEGDIRDHKAVDQLLASERFDLVNHHAAQMDVRKSTEDPLYDAEVNVLGSINLIMNAVRHGVKKIIYISTGGAVYGEPKRLPVEEDHPINPECQYGISKHTVEHYLYLYRLLYKLEGRPRTRTSSPRTTRRLPRRLFGSSAIGVPATAGTALDSRGARRPPFGGFWP